MLAFKQSGHHFARHKAVKCQDLKAHPKFPIHHGKTRKTSRGGAQLGWCSLAGRSEMLFLVWLGKAIHTRSKHESWHLELACLAAHTLKVWTRCAAITKKGSASSRLGPDPTLFVGVSALVSRVTCALALITSMQERSSMQDCVKGQAAVTMPFICSVT